MISTPKRQTAGRHLGDDGTAFRRQRAGTWETTGLHLGDRIIKPSLKDE